MLDARPVWGAWGASLIRLGMYEEAKSKYVHCLTALDASAPTLSHTGESTTVTEVG